MPITVLSKFAVGPHSQDVVVAEDNGALLCKEHNSLWCEHIEDVVTGRMDADSMWHMANYEPNTPTGVNQIFVPVMPTVNIYARVFLEPVFKPRTLEWLGVYLAVIYFTPGKDCRVDGPDFQFIESNTMGLVNPGEGRLTLRQMILDWFSVEVDANHGKCISMKHTYERVFKFEGVEKRGTVQQKFIQAWMMSFWRKCLPCFLEDPNPDATWDSDLIPSD